MFISPKGCDYCFKIRQNLNWKFPRFKNRTLLLTIMQKHFHRQNLCLRNLSFSSLKSHENSSSFSLCLECLRRNNNDKGTQKIDFVPSILIHAIYYVRALNIIECFRSIFSLLSSNFLLLLRNIKKGAYKRCLEHEELLFRLLLLMMMWLLEARKDLYCCLGSEKKNFKWRVLNRRVWSTASLSLDRKFNSIRWSDSQTLEITQSVS